MAQTNEGMSFRNAKVELSSDGTTWTDISGYGSSIAVSGGKRSKGVRHTYEGDTPALASGKRAELDVTCRFLYTEEVAGAFEVARAIYETDGAQALVKYSPKGGNVGNYEYETETGIMTDFMYPQGEAGPGELVPGEFVVSTPYITKSEVS